MFNTVSMVVLMAAVGVAPPDWSRNSDWVTTYQDFNGRAHSTNISLRDGAGSYAQTGQLLNSFYYEAVQHPQGPITPALIGEWRMNGLRGYFVFREPDQNGNMDGYWGQFDQLGNPSIVVGSWDGVLKAVYVPAVPKRKPIDIAAPPTLIAAGPAIQLPIDNLKGAEANFGAKGGFFGLPWVENLNRHKFLVGTMILSKGMNVDTEKGPEFYREGWPFGTCFLVKEGVGITAKHCITCLTEQNGFRVAFLHPNGKDQQTHAPIEAPILLPNVDVAIIRFKTGAETAWPDKFISLTAALDRQRKFDRNAVKTKTAVILQSPKNEGWQMALSGEFTLPQRGEDPRYLHYTTTTDKGSSGAPVFGSEWQLLAVHSGADLASNRGTPIDAVVSEMVQFSAVDAPCKKIVTEMGIDGGGR